MAEQTGTTRRRRSRSSSANGSATGSGERESTKRTVLRRERVLALPDDVSEEQLNALVKAAKDARVKLPTTTSTAWIVVGEHEGSDTKAIEAHAGKPGTPDAKPGAYKAVPTRSWKGGMVYDKPEQPKVERRALED